MGASGEASSISAAQIGQIASSMNQAERGRAASESEAELLQMSGGGGSGDDPQMNEQYLSAMDENDEKKRIMDMIASLGDDGRGGGYMS